MEVHGRRTSLVAAMLATLPTLAAAQSIPSCVVPAGSALVAGYTNAFATGRIEPNATNSPGEPTLAFLGQEGLYGFSAVGDERVWRGKYVADADASAELGILRTQAIVSGRFEPDPLDQPRLGNAYAQSAAWSYDRLTITVDGAPFAANALIHASLLPIGVFSQVYHNLLGPPDGHALTPTGIFGVEVGASEFASSDPTNSANDRGRVSLNVQFNAQGFPGYRVQHASRSDETTLFDPIVGDPFQHPLDFVIRFRSGVPFYLKSRAAVAVSLEMTTFNPLQTQPLGSISDLHGSFGHSIYWNGLSNATLNGEPRTFSVTSVSGTNWAASALPLPEPSVAIGMAAGTIALLVRARRRRA